MEYFTTIPSMGILYTNRSIVVILNSSFRVSYQIRLINPYLIHFWSFIKAATVFKPKNDPGYIGYVNYPGQTLRYYRR